MALVLTTVFNLGLGVLISDGVIGIVGLAVLWLRWREAVRLQTVLPPETEDI
jgi:hypothetical protein